MGAAFNSVNWLQSSHYNTPFSLTIQKSTINGATLHGQFPHVNSEHLRSRFMPSPQCLESVYECLLPKKWSESDVNFAMIFSQFGRNRCYNANSWSLMAESKIPKSEHFAHRKRLRLLTSITYRG
jgi:hypothetical protein